MSRMGFEEDESDRNQSWWKRRSKIQTCVIILLVITVVLIIGLTVALIITIEKLKVPPEDRICDTRDCVETAARLLKSMDQTVDPCDDFYEFACGNFLRETAIPDDKPAVNLVTEMNDLLVNQLRTVLEEIPFEEEPRPFTIVREFYISCLDTDRLEDLAAIKALLKDVGGWPALEGDSWNEKNFDWKKSVFSFRRRGLNLNNFIKIGIQADFKNSSAYVLCLDEAELEISRNNMLGGLADEVVKAYYDYMVDLAVVFGIDKAFAKREVKSMINFKMQLANISLPTSERRDETTLYHPMTLRVLQLRYPTIHWMEYLHGVMNVSDQPINNNQMINVLSPEYISKIGYLLDRSPKRDLANHAIFEALRSLEWALPESVRELEQNFKASVYGIASSPPRWTECVSKAAEEFPLAMGALYVRKFFKDDTKQVANEMVTDIKNAFIKVLKETDWMDNSTKARAVWKAETMESHIAYPEELLDDKELEDYYADLHVNSTGHLIDLMGNVTVFYTNKGFGLLGKEINKTDWRTRYPSAEVNAAYAVQENSIHLPAAILQGVVFGENRLRSMNYGNMGFFIGHEITHGFDDQGRKFDQLGNLVSWWANGTSDAFLKKADCIIQQYSNYTVPEIDYNLDGSLSQGENIADNGGVKEAYIAYNAWVERNGPEPRLPGLNFTAKQLFWISAANCWCEKERIDSLMTSVLDVHSPGRFRVLGSFSNSDYFAADFSCPVGSRMNPKHKCRVW